MDLITKIEGKVTGIEVLPFQEDVSSINDSIMKAQRVILQIESNGEIKTANALLNVRGVENKIVGQWVKYLHHPKSVPEGGILHEFRLEGYFGTMKRTIRNSVYLQ